MSVPGLFLKRILIVILIACGLAVIARPANAADLSAAEKETARQADVLLKQIETAVKLAQESAGAGTASVTGAKARLVAVRLQPAKDGLPAAMQRIKTLPADHEQVVALQKRYDSATAAVAALQARLESKPAVPDPGTVKLDFRQSETLKLAQSTLNEIEGQRAALEKVVADLKGVEDATTIDHRLLQKAMSSVAFARQRDGFMANHMGKLPANGIGVAPVNDAWKAAMASVDASEKALAPIHKKLTDLVNPASYPQFDADLKRMQELAGQYSAIDRFTVNRELAGAMYSQSGAVKEEQARINKAYAALVFQKTEQGEKLLKMDAYLTEKLKLFSDAANAQKESLPKEIAADIAKINRMADEAVRESKPAFFAQGIPDELAFTSEKVALYAVLAPEPAKAVAADLEKTRAEMKAKQKSLHAAIIAANEPAPDRYTAADRARLIELATTTWKQQQPDAVVMAVRIPSEKWARSTVWRYTGGGNWTLHDVSRLQVQLIVKHDAGLAVIRPVNLSINHVNGDNLTAGAMDDVKDELIPQRLLPQAKVK
jgi:hypothetical protein